MTLPDYTGCWMPQFGFRAGVRCFQVSVGVDQLAVRGGRLIGVHSQTQDNWAYPVSSAPPGSQPCPTQAVGTPCYNDAEPIADVEPSAFEG